jgi:hypothetical protein
MGELPVEEREALEAAKPGVALEADEWYEAGWLACREWAERRHRQETAALNEEHEDLLTKAEDICWKRAEERHIERMALAVLGASEQERRAIASEKRERVLREGLATTIDLLDADSFDRAQIDPLRALASPTPQETP